MIESLILIIKFLGLLACIAFLMTIIVAIVQSWFIPSKSAKMKQEIELLKSLNNIMINSTKMQRNKDNKNGNK